MKRIILSLCLAMLALSACEMSKQDLGLSRSTPDETAVEMRRPLDLPPDFNVLP